MDPLSISAGILALLHAANKIIHFTSSAKGATSAISALLAEMKSLRNMLESIYQVLASSDSPKTIPATGLDEIAALCNSEDGPIIKELNSLQEILRLPDWAGQDGSRRKALIYSLTWPLKEGDTKKILERIVRLKQDLQLVLAAKNSASLSQLLQSQESLKRSVKSLQTDERFSKIVNWLGAPDVSTNLNAALKKRHADTGLWLFETSPYEDWKAAQTSFLWLHGIPGCGKTILSSTIIETLSQAQSDSVVIYFYFDFNDSTKQQVGNMLRSLVRQLFMSFDAIPEPIGFLFKNCQDGVKSPGIHDLEEVFEALVNLNNRTFVVLDALDECEAQQELLDFIASVIEKKNDRLSMIMTSRRLREFDVFFGDVLEDRSIMSIQNGYVDNDIRSYVHERLLHDRRFKRWKTHPKVQEEIESRLMEKSEGMFRWAACQIDALSSCINLKKLREALGSLPATLDETYNRILCKIDPRYEHEVHQILQWLTFSLRPLSLEEVAELFAVDECEGSIFDSEKRLADPSDVLEICSSLVTCIDTNDDHAKAYDNDDSGEAAALSSTKQKVQLAHFSVKEYLVSDRIRTGSAASYSTDETRSHIDIGETSLSCLLMYDVAFYSDSDDFSKSMPLARYAAEYWYKHLAMGGGNVPDAAIDLFSSTEKMRIWTCLYDLDVDITNQETASELEASPFYYAVLTGLERLVRLLVEVNKGRVQQKIQDGCVELEDHNAARAVASSHPQKFVNPIGGRLHTPLQVAAWTGQQAIVELLLEQDADPNLYGRGKGGSALSAAAHGGFLSIVELLLSNGADVHEGLSAGSENGQDIGSEDDDTSESVFSPFIDPPSDVVDRCAKGQGRETALFKAVSRDHAKIVNLLLDRGAMPNTRNGEEGRTALHEACNRGRTDIVQVLLRKGALVTKTDLQGRTPLMQACLSREADDKELVRMLLEAGADFDKFDPSTGSALRAATIKGHESIVRLLLGSKADPNKFSPLMEALRRGHTEIARLLMDAGANVNVIQDFGIGIPLWLHQRPVTTCLAECFRSIHGASRLDIHPGREIKSVEEFRGWLESPLWIAAAMGDIGSVRRLLDHDADIRFRNIVVDMTALDIASFEEHRDVVDLLAEIMFNEHKGIEGSDDDRQGQGDSIENESLVLEQDDTAQSQTGASEAASDYRPEREVEGGSDERNEIKPRCKSTGLPGKKDSDDGNKHLDDNLSIDVPLLLTSRPEIVTTRDGNVVSYDLLSLLRKAKKDDFSLLGGTFPLETFLQRPDLAALRLWWEPGNPASREALNRDGHVPVITEPPDIDLDNLSYRILMPIKEKDGAEDENIRARQDREGR